MSALTGDLLSKCWNYNFYKSRNLALYPEIRKEGYSNAFFLTKLYAHLNSAYRN